MAVQNHPKSTQLLILLMITYSTSTLSLQTNAETCNCFESNVDFSTCKSGQADYRRHTDRDIRLTDRCLPQIPAK